MEKGTNTEHIITLLSFVVFLFCNNTKYQGKTRMRVSLTLDLSWNEYLYFKFNINTYEHKIIK